MAGYDSPHNPFLVAVGHVVHWLTVAALAQSARATHS